MNFPPSKPQRIYKANRMTVVFQNMRKSCPQQMKAYADCVMSKYKDNSLEKGSCSKEFDLVKDCYRSSLK